MRFPIKNIDLKKSSSLLFFSFLLLVLSSCVNLEHIKQFAETSTEINTYNQLVDDYVSYPDRIASLQPESQKPALEKIKQDRLCQKNGFKALHQVASEYMTALGKLASDEVVTYDAELNSFTKTVSSSRIVKPETVAASGKISKILLKAFTDQWRKNKLKKIIEQSNTDFQNLIEGLKFITEKGFMNELDNEMVAVNNVFRKSMAGGESPPPAITLLL